MLTSQKKSVKAGKYVNTAHVDSTLRTYKQQRWVHNSKRIGKEDSLSVWYSVAELEEFLQRIKAQGGDGVKMYFGAYPADYAEKPEYAGRQTIVLVATQEKETERGTVNKDMYTHSESGANILAYNAGRICPPFCGPGTSLDDDWGGIGITIVDKGDEGIAIV